MVRKLQMFIAGLFADSDEISAIFQLREKCKEKKSVLILFIMLDVRRRKTYSSLFSFVNEERNSVPSYTIIVERTYFVIE